MNVFTDLLEDLNEFQITEKIYSEQELEISLKEFLETREYKVSRQKIIAGFRNDLIVERSDKKICLELKVNADMSCSEQLDNYLSFFKDGIILVCWRSSKNLQQVFKNVKDSIEIPVDIVQIRNNMSLV